MKTILRIILLIVLKVLEIGGVVFLPYWFGLFVRSHKIGLSTGCLSPIAIWLDGTGNLVIYFLLIVTIVLILIGFSRLIKFNWNLVKKITR